MKDDSPTIKQRALITGGGGTIGKAIARALLEDNRFDVILVGRRLSFLKAAQQDLRNITSHCGGQVYCEVCDVSVESQVVEMFARLKEEGMSVDLLINNAGRYTHDCAPCTRW